MPFFVRKPLCVLSRIEGKGLMTSFSPKLWRHERAPERARSLFSGQNIKINTRRPWTLDWNDIITLIIFWALFLGLSCKLTSAQWLSRLSKEVSAVPALLREPCGGGLVVKSLRASDSLSQLSISNQWVQCSGVVCWIYIDFQRSNWVLFQFKARFTILLQA